MGNIIDLAGKVIKLVCKGINLVGMNFVGKVMNLVGKVMDEPSTLWARTVRRMSKGGVWKELERNNTNI